MYNMWYNTVLYKTKVHHIIQYYILRNKNLVLSLNNKHICEAGLNEDNGDQTLHLKLPLRFIYIILKSTIQSIIYRTCDLFQNTKTHPASETYAQIQHPSLPCASASLIRRIIHSSLGKLGPVIIKIYRVIIRGHLLQKL